MNIILTLILIGTLQVTSYRPVPEQTDSSPNYTSIGVHVEPGGAAISRDLLCGACMRLHRRCDHPNVSDKIHYGQWLYIEDYGFVCVNDVMGDYASEKVKGKWKRFPIRNHIDIFVKTYKEEASINVKKRKVYKINLNGEIK